MVQTNYWSHWITCRVRTQQVSLEQTWTNSRAARKDNIVEVFLWVTKIHWANERWGTVSKHDDMDYWLVSLPAEWRRFLWRNINQSVRQDSENLCALSIQRDAWNLFLQRLSAQEREIDIERWLIYHWLHLLTLRFFFKFWNLRNFIHYDRIILQSFFI